MNERIKTLIETTVKDYHASLKPATHTIPVSRLKKISEDAKDAEIAIIPNEFCEKFAELIVQECATLMAEQKKYYADPGKYETMEYYARMEAKEDAFSDAEEIIKKHFGVE